MANILVLSKQAKRKKNRARRRLARLGTAVVRALSNTQYDFKSLMRHRPRVILFYGEEWKEKRSGSYVKLSRRNQRTKAPRDKSITVLKPYKPAICQRHF